MTLTHPGDEPDPGDMATDPDPQVHEHVGHQLPEDEAEKLGTFASEAIMSDAAKPTDQLTGPASVTGADRQEAGAGGHPRPSVRDGDDDPESTSPDRGQFGAKRSN